MNEKIYENIKFVGHIHKKFMSSIFSQIDALLVEVQIIDRV